MLRLRVCLLSDRLVVASRGPSAVAELLVTVRSYVSAVYAIQVAQHDCEHKSWTGDTHRSDSGAKSKI